MKDERIHLCSRFEAKLRQSHDSNRLEQVGVDHEAERLIEGTQSTLDC